MMFYFCVVAVVFLAQQIRVSETLEDCHCVPMSSKDMSNGTEPLFSSPPLKILKDCDKEGRANCKMLCKTLATLAQYDPDSAKGFCVTIKKNITNVYISVFSKVCSEGEYEYTGLTFSKPICCVNKQHVPC